MSFFGRLKKKSGRKAKKEGKNAADDAPQQKPPRKHNTAAAHKSNDNGSNGAGANEAHLHRPYDADKWKHSLKTLRSKKSTPKARYVLLRKTVADALRDAEDFAYGSGNGRKERAAAQKTLLLLLDFLVQEVSAEQLELKHVAVYFKVIIYLVRKRCFDPVYMNRASASAAPGAITAAWLKHSLDMQRWIFCKLSRSSLYDELLQFALHVTAVNYFQLPGVCSLLLQCMWTEEDQRRWEALDPALASAVDEVLQSPHLRQLQSEVSRQRIELCFSFDLESSDTKEQAQFVLEGSRKKWRRFFAPKHRVFLQFVPKWVARVVLLMNHCLCADCAVSPSRCSIADAADVSRQQAFQVTPGLLKRKGTLDALGAPAKRAAFARVSSHLKQKAGSSAPSNLIFDWSGVPGYISIVRSCIYTLGLLKPSQISSYHGEGLLLDATSALLKNAFLLRPMLETLLSRTNVHKVEHIYSCMDVAREWMFVVHENHHFLPPNFPYNLLYRGLDIMLSSLHFRVLSKALLFIFHVASFFFGEQRRRLMRLLLEKHFPRLFLHWSSDVRLLFCHVIVFKVQRSDKELQRDYRNFEGRGMYFEPGDSWEDEQCSVAAPHPLLVNTCASNSLRSTRMKTYANFTKREKALDKEHSNMLQNAMEAMAQQQEDGGTVYLKSAMAQYEETRAAHAEYREQEKIIPLEELRPPLLDFEEQKFVDLKDESSHFRAFHAAEPKQKQGQLRLSTERVMAKLK